MRRTTLPTLSRPIPPQKTQSTCPTQKRNVKFWPIVNGTLGPLRSFLITASTKWVQRGDSPRGGGTTVYRTTANRLRRIATATALTLGAAGGVVASTITLVSSGAGASTVAIAPVTSSAPTATNTVVATSPPTKASHTTGAPAAITSPSTSVAARSAAS